MSRVILSSNAAVKTMLLIALCKGEVGWRGTVERLPDDEFYIKDIYLYPQTVSAATVKATAEELAEWEQTLDDETYNTTRFHGHSHVNFGPDPSGTDKRDREETVSHLQIGDYYIFLIINKSLDYTCDIVRITEAGPVTERVELAFEQEGIPLDIRLVK